MKRYTEPKICSYKDLKKQWYVYFYWDKQKASLKFYGLNKFKTYKERMFQAEALREAILLKLNAGWNPKENTYEKGLEELSFLNLIDALKFSLEKKKNKISEATYKDYKSTINLIEPIIVNKFNYFKITEISRKHILQIFEETRIKLNWTNRNYNKNLGYLKSLFSELVEWEVINNNPAYLVKMLKVVVRERKRTLTKDEKIIVRNKILNEIPNFWNVCLIIYHTGIRPKEVLSLTVEMIDLNLDSIKVKAEITKDSEYRDVPINKYLKKMFMEMNLNKFPKDYFVFGKTYKNTNLFSPNPFPITRKYGTELWNKLVKKDLKIDVDWYRFKHLGADDKILSNVPVDALKELYGHSSVMMTETYVSKLQEIRRKQILENSLDY